MILQTRFLQLLSEFIAILYLLLHGRVLCDGGFNFQFIKSEADALLKFKEGFKDPSNRLSSWKPGKDCCQWKGVGCNTTTGHVISLDFHCQNSLDKLQGELNSALLELPYLSSLNLSGNDFMQSKVPDFLGTMKTLKHLDLSGANFKGNLPDNLGNLSLLESLDLSNNDFSTKANPLNWFHGLSSLKTLDLSGVDLSNNANDWFLHISMLNSLVTLRLSCCRLEKLPPSPLEVTFESLLTLDLSVNYFNSTIPDWLSENLHHIQKLNLSHNQLQGTIPDSIGKLVSLVALDLSNNELSGSIPDSIGKLVSLVALDLSNNELIGSIPLTLGRVHAHSSAGTDLKELHLSNNHLSGSLERSISQLSKLDVLDLAQNYFEGILTDAHLANFSTLRVLDLSFNKVTLNMSKNWLPPFQLETIGLGDCKLGPQFPLWIKTQKNFSHIDISNAGIHDMVPDWFWDFPANIEYMNLSDNGLRRCGHDFSKKLKLHTLDLSNNSFSCPLPHLPPNLMILKLAENLFHGNISHICEILGANNSLGFLDLSENQFSGIIPNCWRYGKNMITLKLGSNNFSGSIPDSLGSLTSLQILSMYENNLSGKIPDTLKGCQRLTLLDLGSNLLRGPIPSWIGIEMRILKVLILRRNSFEEHIPPTLCLLKSLLILDLSENHLTGEIPTCGFPAMATEESINDMAYNMELTSLSIYQFNGRLLSTLDLSSNYLTQGIPIAITKLIELQLLNLSRNQLVGSIPSDIGEMENLEALDLSRNQLSCTIPISMVNLSFLEFLNVSHNTLSGKIPTAKQFSTFASSSFEGNPHLCDLSFAKTCPGNNSFEDTHCHESEKNREHENEVNHEEEDNTVFLGMSPFSISMGVGFFTGFWVFWGSLILIRPWRYAYFTFLSNLNDKIYVTVAIAFAKWQRKYHSQHASE